MYNQRGRWWCEEKPRSNLNIKCTPLKGRCKRNGCETVVNATSRQTCCPYTMEPRACPSGCAQVRGVRVESDDCVKVVTLENTGTEWYYENYDGHANNLSNHAWGRAHEPLLRRGVTLDLPRSAFNPRAVSNAVCAGTSALNSARLSDLFWAWGQFVDHELDLTPEQHPAEPLNITTPSDDPVAPNMTIPLTRAAFVTVDGRREQVNVISAYMDATNVYGYSAARASALRAHDGTGKLLVGTATNGEKILPDNSQLQIPDGMAHLSNQTDGMMVAAGDVRANENVLLLAMHVLFVREHNRQCDEYVAANPQWLGNDDKIFAEARKRVIAIEQAITYNEFLPLLVGDMGAYRGYSDRVNAGITSEFSTVAYRVGHTMVSGELRVGNSSVQLRDVFFTPDYVRTNGVDALLTGAASKRMQELDTIVVEDIRSFLFGAPAMGLMHDLAAINIQRARDHGLPDYNTMREQYGLARYTRFDQITSDVSVQNRLKAAYGSDITVIDPWVGGLAETHLPGAQVGELFSAIIRDQFERLRTGDRFYFENDPTLTASEKAQLRSTRLADVIRRNSTVTDVQSDAFIVPV